MASSTLCMITIFFMITSMTMINNVDSQASFRKFRQFIHDLAGNTIDDGRLFRNAVNNNKIQKKIPIDQRFPCDNPTSYRSEERPRSVHALQPGDIDVIGAMGDSLTAAAGAGAVNLLQVMAENRGVSWSIGGKGTWREFLTLPNILKEFNPKLIGFSTGDVHSIFKASRFNVAELAATSPDLPHMVRELVKRIKNDREVNLEQDWKLITIMMGANDFCFNMCYYDDPFKMVERHKEELNYTLTYMMKNLPKTLINIVPAPDVELIRYYRGIPSRCALTHRVFCPCFHNEPLRKPLYPLYRKVVKKWREVDMEIAQYPEFEREDFAVVSQPFTLYINVSSDSAGNTDNRIISADCFHLSQIGHARAANALWNNMMEPVGSKSPHWDKLFTRFMCPSPSSPYIFTNKNSFPNVV